MAHMLDKLFLTAAAVFFTFILTLTGTGSIPLSMLAAAIAPLPLAALFRLLCRKWTGSRLFRRRMLKKRAAETVSCWALYRDADCSRDILSLLKAAYPASAAQFRLSEEAEPDDICVLILYSISPAGEDTAAGCLAELRRRNAQQGVIVSVSGFTPEARRLSLLPKPPEAAFIDGEMLAALIVRCPDAVQLRRMPKLRPPRPVFNRGNARRLLPTALFFYALFLVFRLTLYLPAALLMLWCVLMAHRQKAAVPPLFSDC